MVVLNGSAAIVALTVSVLVYVTVLAGIVSGNGSAASVTLTVLIGVGVGRALGLVALVLYLCATAFVIANSVLISIYVLGASSRRIVTAGGEYGK
jgi:hypothetical protein